ncbi:MAG: GH36-type glycosyl hydrolase domain-containing protein [Longimicrobiales bacterium]
MAYRPSPGRFVSQFLRIFSRPRAHDEVVPGPIRGEPLGAERLAERARSLAEGQRIADAVHGGRSAPLLVRLRETRAILEAGHERLATATSAARDVGPAGEWLLDNYHVVQEHIREVRESLPRSFYRELPELVSGQLAGYPRVYEIAITLISHTEGRISVDNVDLFVAAFQQRAPLSLGELWALPAMLRLGLIENIRRMTLRTLQRLDQTEIAEWWAARLIDAHALGDDALGAALSEFLMRHPPLTPNFVSQFLHRIRVEDAAFTPLAWLEPWLAEEGTSPDEARARSTEHLALTHVAMANSITSLRAIAQMDWRSFVERESRMEAALRDDPSGFYPRMTFATRDQYRHAVERVAKRARQREEDVARRAIELARAADGQLPADARQAHVGYYLVDDGRSQLERETRYRPGLAERFHRSVLRHPNVVFVGGILAASVIALAALFWLGGPAARAAWLSAGLLALIPAWDIGVRFVSQLVTALLPPRTLPKLEFREHGIPESCRTVVVVPTLFDSVAAVREALEHLEVQFLANRGPHLHFAILSDFTDSPAESRDDDEAIIAAAIEGTRALNARYAAGAVGPFHLFHRPRRWNPAQGLWMGWERKRGKLAQFNRFVRGTDDGAFSTIVGDVDAIRRVRYVITLDADTVLPPDAAALLVGTIAHPLNHAVYDASRGYVVRGYGIIQPRVSVALPSAFRSRFAVIHSGHPGVDPYTTAVSDVYQDLFGEGSFTGKGIYDVDAFGRATRGRFPTDTLLSHDLIEGNYARAGLATDIEVYDDYPTRYLTYTRRLHRWIRGDWQLLDWLTPHVPGPDGPEPNRLSILSRWKILDNLRRSVVEIAQLLFLVAGWTVFPGSPLRWTALGLAAIAAPWIIALLLTVLRPPLDKSWRAYYAAILRDAATSAQQVMLAIAFLPHLAWVSADAIVRTLWRLFVSRRNLLEWQTASHTERMVSGSARAIWRGMWPAEAIAGAVLIVVVSRAILLARADAASDPSWSAWELWAVLPLIALWLASPAVAFIVSTSPGRPERRLPPARRAEALRYALLHWRFFERFATARTNWLAPDNFQEEPTPVVAMRTSPTNIGLQLLATVSAYDLGFITADDVAERLELAFRSLERMRRFRGHFFNWYGLGDLRVLEPAYISTVDSGNLAGHLIAVQQACLGMLDEPIFGPRAWQAIDTALGLAYERLRGPGEAELDMPERAEEEVRTARMTAARELHGARAVLPQARDAHTTDSPREILEMVTRALERARDALASAADSHDPSLTTAEALEWIAWSLRLVHERRAAVDGLEPELVAGRLEATVAAYPTLGDLAKRSPGQGTSPASNLAARLEALAARASRYAAEMDFRFLFDAERKLFAIGFRYDTHALDTSHYDLLASEARLASFLAIARRDAPPEHWFRLGRALRRAEGETTLVSWSGSMFEYLMPLLVMQSLPATVLDQSYQGALRRHISYGAERGVPWGISESAYNLRDRHFTYQYRAFGVPDLALKRGLSQDLVIAPYASALAAMMYPQRALANLAALERLGALGPWGFRDALDYTRPAPDRKYAIVRTYMAHHIGMSLVALTNALSDQVWQRRFHSDPLVRSVELLLHERIPRRLELQHAAPVSADDALPEPEMERPAVREVEAADTPYPVIALLGHLPYTMMVSHCGSGYSRFEGLAVTRWRADGTRDDTGQFCYVRDLARGRVWSAGHHPVRAQADLYHAQLATDRATFIRVDGEIETRTEIVSVPADAAEVRRITLTNNGSEVRELELTSYAEVVLAPPHAERAHPAFANLFVETEWHAWCTAVTATRRPRSVTERRLWLVHVVDSGRDRVGPVTCETDRARFLGRGRTTARPTAMDREGRLSGTTGAVLDPVVALRTRVRVEPGQSASVSFATLVATSRERAFELADRYHDPHAAQRALDLAWTAAQIELRELGVSPADAAVYQELAGHLFYSHPALRAPQDELVRNEGSQPLLWAMRLSGDWPILLASIDSPEGLPTLRQVLIAHQYWRRRGMTVDLVVLNSYPSTYLGDLHDKIMTAVLASVDASTLDRPGGVFIRRRDQLDPKGLLMLRATARVHIDCDGAHLGRSLAAADTEENAGAGAADEWEAPVESPYRSASRVTPTTTRVVRRLRALASVVQRVTGADDDPGGGPPEHEVERAGRPGAKAARKRALERADERDGKRRHSPRLLENGLGGLRPDLDYEIRLRPGEATPAPWSNVVANPHGGFLVTERGAACTWAINSQFFRLTPWHNDPVSDPASEVVYLREEDSGEIWSATPAPCTREAGSDDGSTYVIRHGAGVTSFEYVHAEIETYLEIGMADDAAVKLSVLRVSNRSARPRRISVTGYAEWTLGALREHTQHQVRTTFDPNLEAIFARNTFDPEFAGWVAFCAMSERIATYTADRQEFLGRNGSADDPAGMHSAALAGTTGAAIDPCAALRCVLELAPGETRELVVVLGAAPAEEEARRAVAEYRDVVGATASLRRAVNAWAERLTVIQVGSPEPSFDAMLNRWALYQALACRMWGRTAFYQSSGAYGFRDQLQDVMAFVYAEPDVAREHILLATSRQFVEGDVQHWWHPPSGRGVRTRFSDDLAWLPYVVDHYVRVTGDSGVLDEEVPFLTMRALQSHEHEAYDLPVVADERASVYEHCLRALRKACTAGARGLPLIGSGDWNDGMNRVGVEGRGESVWLAWFLVTTLRSFAEQADARGDGQAASELRRQADAYVEAVESNAWDGAWYRRAYFDDGTPVGSAQSDECQIDSIAQSWSVISGAGDPARQKQAMRSLEEHLVRDDARLIMLLTPPFDKTPNDPGYIKGYLPGVRENGAQYTHAALWAALATAMRGDAERAFELYQFVNPLTHARTPEEAETYRVEPYVVAADVYTAEGHVGRGGWTWYTGSASWLYRIGLEAILGFTKRGDTLTMSPCVPRDWPEFTIEYRFGESRYHITVTQPGRAHLGVAEVSVDGRVLDSPVIRLVDDGGRHEVVVRAGTGTAALTGRPSHEGESVDDTS